MTVASATLSQQEVIFILCIRLMIYFIFPPGIKSVLVGLLAQKAEVKFDNKKITTDEIVCYVKELGYGCDLMDQSGQGENTVDLIVSFPTLVFLCT